jgi:hypothetical protein
MSLRGRGINYDTGFFPGGHGSRSHFDLEDVRRDMHVIAHDLHCTAVRISGGDPERLSAAAAVAAAEGLEIWFAPFPCEMTAGQLRPFLADCADRAEAVRVGNHAPVVLVLGCELSLFAAGFLPGDTVYQRIDRLMSGGGAGIRTVATQLDKFFVDVVADARERFAGPITYASGTWEFIDWTPFDIVAVDAYRDRSNAGTYAEELRSMVARHDKPVVVSEFGCCTYAAAGDRGGLGWDIDVNGDYVRDEGEQVRYMTECLDAFDAAGVDSAFWFTFAGFAQVDQLDLASYGLVRMVGESTWEPKESFHALAKAYGSDGVPDGDQHVG